MASFTENMRMASLFPGGQRGYGGSNQPDLWNEFQGSVIPAMQKRKRDDELDRRQNDLYDYNEQQRRQFLNPSLAGQMVNKPMNVVEGESGPSLLDKWDARDRLKKRDELTEKALGFKESKQAGDIGFKYDKLTADTGVKQETNKIAQFKATHPGMKIVIPKGGNITAIDPITGKAMDLGIDSGTLTDKEKMDLTGQQAIEQIGARGRQTRQTQEVGQENSLAQIAARGNEQRQTNVERPISNTQQAVAVKSKAEQLLNQHPEYAGYIIYNPETKIYDLKNAGDPFTFKRLSDEIYGTGAKDIELPKDVIKKSVTPTTKTPTIQSKYKVTVR